MTRPKPTKEVLGYLEEQGLCEHSTSDLYCSTIDKYLSGQIGEDQMWSMLGGRGNQGQVLGKCPACR